VGYQLGVDLGTTYTAAAVIRNGQAEVATLGTRSLEIPSVVYLRDDGEMLVGEAAERRSLTEPDRFAREFKRRIGDPTPVMLGGSPFSAHTLMAKLLRAVVKVVADREGAAPDGITVTHPANWGQYKRELLDQALHQADVGPTSKVSEPEAAAVHYASTTRVGPGQTVAVYDLGGGTFDAAIVRNEGRHFALLGEPQGIEQLGGVYFDDAVFSYVGGYVSEALAQLDPDDPGSVAAVSRLRRDCVEAKEALSWDTDTTIPVALPNQRTEVRLTRSEFEDMARPALAESVEAMRRALRSAGIDPSELTAVLLVGGSSRIPLVGQMLVNALGRPIAIDVHPKHAVALGAAHVARAGAGQLVGASGAPAPPAPPTGLVAPGGPGGPGHTGGPGDPGGPAPGMPFAPPTGAAGGGAPPLVVQRSSSGQLVEPTSSGGYRPAETDPWSEEHLPPGARGGGGGLNRQARIGIGMGVGAAVAVLLFVLLSGGGGGGDDATTTTAGDQTATTAAGGGTTVAPAAAITVPQGPALDTDTLAYTQRAGDFWNIWLLDVGSGESTKLTNETALQPRLPVLSPDRTSVAYTVQNGAAWQLWATDTQGSSKLQLADGLAADARATWSPDGTELAFVSDAEGQADLYVLSLLTGERRRITTTPETEGDPAWSTDGAEIAYWATVAGNQDIFAIPAAGGQVRRITRDPAPDGDPAWSPDGVLAFARDMGGGDTDIFVADAAGGNEQQLTTSTGSDEDPAWSPDGSMIAFESRRDTADVEATPDFIEVYVMNADGSDQRRLTNRDGLDNHPAWGRAPQG
jgi:Tol biopolymer transport system component